MEFHKKTFESWNELETKILFNTLTLIKENISQIDPDSEDFAMTGNLLIDLYEISEELEKRLLLA